MNYLDGGHSVSEDYKQRVPVKMWRQILLENRDTIIFNGTVRQLVAKNLGYGVVEVSKKPLQIDEVMIYHEKSN